MSAEPVTCDVVCGYLVSGKSLTHFADAKGIAPAYKISLRPRVAQFVEQNYPGAGGSVMTVKYPRFQSPFLSPRHLMFITRARYGVPCDHQIAETDQDQRILESYRSQDSAMQVLLAHVKFVTVPNPSNDMRLPGEELRSEDKNRKLDTEREFNRGW